MLVPFEPLPAYIRSADRFACPRCNAQQGECCRAITHRGEFKGVRHHVQRLALAEFECQPDPYPSILCKH